jgi:DNA-directed RNA polymerase specialized sigma24 family protein
VGRVLRRRTGRSTSQGSSPGLPTLPSGSDIAQSVRAAAGELPFPQAQALWLVDVCGCSYAEAAAEARTTREGIVRRVASGREALRRRVPAVAHVGPENSRRFDGHGGRQEEG